MKKVTINTTLIRDNVNGLGFTIAGGKGSPAYKENSDVSSFGIFYFTRKHFFCFFLFKYRRTELVLYTNG